MIKQFVPSDYCLHCQGCCRYLKDDSVWAPCLLDEEIQELLDRKGLPAIVLSQQKRLCLVAHPEGKDGFICPLLVIPDNTCRIYDSRPFECQLYPFLLNLRGKKVVLTVDLNCPYVRERAQSGEFKAYAEYIAAFLNTPAQITRLKNNPHILAAYEDVAEIIELDLAK